jgi:CrcB protein
MPTPLAVGFGGVIGVLARYSLDRLIERRTLSVFPWSTFVINGSGCLLIGAVIAAFVDRHHAPPWLSVGLAVGVLGGYTTFSTFAQETLDLFEEGRAGTALLYATTSVLVGVVAVLIGTRIGRLI